MKLLGIFVLSFALAGCTTAPSAEPTVDPPSEPSYSSTEQYASALSRHMESWQEASNDAGDCRFEQVMAPDSIQAASCYLREMTAVINAELALRSLSELTPPPEVEDLVSETEQVLGKIAAVPLREECGELTPITKSDPCNAALASLFALWSQLDKELAAWSPYL